MINPSKELFTLRDWLRWGISRFNEAGVFYGHGCDNAYDEAVWLLLHGLHLPLDRLEPFLDARLTEAERETVFTLFHKRIEDRVPTAYLTNEAWLGEFSFYVDERVIIPRSYFAELLEENLVPWLEDPFQVESALDLCTGSGCLAILMAHTFPNAQVDAVDISPDALAVAQRNVADYGLDEVIELVQSDVFSGLEGRKYDLIISNPPYVTTCAMEVIPKEYQQEPELALVAGEDGLDVVRKILAEAATHLNDDGLLLVEVGHNADLVEAAWPNVPFTWVDAPSGDSKVFLLNKTELETYFS